MPELTVLDASDPGFRETLRSRLAVDTALDEELTAEVTRILRDVRLRGDDALLEYTNRFDRRRAGIDDLEITAGALHEAAGRVPAATRKALEQAAQRVRAYHEHQRQETWSYRDEDGSLLGQQITPLDSVGVYVPGGRAAYPSSVLMNTIPAKVAAVEQVVMVVPAPEGQIDPVVQAAAVIAGVDRVFSVGGAQAVAALAYGTELVPAVDKIVGPGNRYVAAAKRLVFGTVGIDMIAGPSEVLIVNDGSGDPDWLAMDLFAQAEHDEDARAILISSDAGFIDAVRDSLARLLPEMERGEIIRRSLEKNGCLIRVGDLAEAVEIANIIAPEHLELAVAAPQDLLTGIRHAGAIFLGHYTAEVFGDYCAGPNHVLPTARTARFSSPLGVPDFQKRSSLLMCSEASAAKLAATASVLAREEGLTAHARSAEYRRKT